MVDSAGYWLRQIPKSIESVRARRALVRNSPELARLHDAYRRGVATRDWSSVHASASSIAVLAERHEDAPLMGEMASALERLEDYPGSARLALLTRHLRRGSLPKEWAGESLQSRTLLIDFTENAKQSIGRVIRYARLARVAAQQCSRCIVLVEPRLAPLLQRSFPLLDIRPALAPDESCIRDADFVATFEQLAAWLVPDKPLIERSFAPLLADPLQVREMRSRYDAQRQSGLLIGLSWGSKSHEKDVPGLNEWAHWMKQSGARFVSLQYGAIDAALRRLRSGDDGRLIQDPLINQLINMDAFAAQIGALDGVISISNTAAHLAGAMGIPSVFMIDDKFHTTWPVMSETSPWYPSARIVRKDGRAWRQVLRELPALPGLFPPAATGMGPICKFW
jgi:hypothetical protein